MHKVYVVCLLLIVLVHSVSDIGVFFEEVDFVWVTVYFIFAQVKSEIMTKYCVKMGQNSASPSTGMH